MNILTIGELARLKEHLALLDTALTSINNDIIKSEDPESDGLFDRGEYLIGSGFVAAQRYIQTVYLSEGVKCKTALYVGENLTDYGTYAHAIWQGANYWKHEEEWWTRVSKGLPLEGQAATSAEKLEQYVSWAEYTCANLLALLLDGKELSLVALIPILEAWTEAVRAHKQAL